MLSWKPGWNAREHLHLGRDLLRWLIVLLPVAATIGSACALFLWALDRATSARFAHPALLFALPLAGTFVAWLYEKLGQSSQGGNDLLIDEIHQPNAGVPGRMAPLILVATVITHLFGGSAGREGTAVQMGGSLAATFGRSAWGRWFKFDARDQRTLLMAGIAAGFGGVFGTPLAGAVFAMEVLAIGRMDYEGIVPCLIAALVGDWACQIWGIHHSLFHVAALSSTRLDAVLALKVALAAVAFGLTSTLFAELVHGVQDFFKTHVRSPLLRPFIGGLVIIALVTVLHSRDYLGLGDSSPDAHAVTIASSFLPGGVDTWSWFLKLVFTAITLGSGFKGGEVTPLFFIGATLGNVLAVLLHAPVDLFAALGFVAVFAGAANTPLACTLMALELFGSANAPYFAIACFVAYFFSGHSGIYSSQRIGIGKVRGLVLPLDASLHSLRSSRTKRSGERRSSTRLRIRKPRQPSDKEPS